MPSLDTVAAEQKAIRDREVAKAEQVQQERAARTKQQAEARFVASVKAYGPAVKAAVRDAAKVKPGPVTPTHRTTARSLLHWRPFAGISTIPNNIDPTMRPFVELVETGQWLLANPEGVDATLIEELSQAEAEAWGALIRSAQSVAGEL